MTPEQQEYQDYLDYQDYQSYLDSSGTSSPGSGSGGLLSDLGDIGKGFVYSTGASAGGALSGVQDALSATDPNLLASIPFFGTALSGLKGLSDLNPEFGQQTYEKGQQLLSDTRQDFGGEPGTWRSRAFDIGVGAGKLVPAIAMRASPWALAAQAGIDAFGGKYGELKSQDLPPADVTRGATVSGAANAALSFPLARAVLGPNPGLFARLAESTLGGGFQGGLGSLVDDASNYVAGLGLPSLDEALGKAKESAITGGVTGAIASVPGEIAAKRSANIRAQREAQLAAEFESKIAALNPEPQKLLGYSPEPPESLPDIPLIRGGIPVSAPIELPQAFPKSPIVTPFEAGSPVLEKSTLPGPGQVLDLPQARPQRGLILPEDTLGPRTPQDEARIRENLWGAQNPEEAQNLRGVRDVAKEVRAQYPRVRERINFTDQLEQRLEREAARPTAEAPSIANEDLPLPPEMLPIRDLLHDYGIHEGPLTDQERKQLELSRYKDAYEGKGAIEASQRQVDFWTKKIEQARRDGNEFLVKKFSEDFEYEKKALAQDIRNFRELEAALEPKQKKEGDLLSFPRKVFSDDEKGSVEFPTAVFNKALSYFTGEDIDAPNPFKSDKHFLSIEGKVGNAIRYPQTLADNKALVSEHPEIANLPRTLRREGERAHAVVFDSMPVRQSLKALSPDESVGLSAFLRADRRNSNEMLKAGRTPRDYSPEELKAAGLSDNQINAYGQVREWANQSLDVLQEALSARAENLPDALKASYLAEIQQMVTSLKAAKYVPFSRYGGYAFSVIDSQGNTLRREQFESKGAFHQAKKRAEIEAAKTPGNKVIPESVPKFDPLATDRLPPGLEMIRKEFDPEAWTKRAATRPPQGFTRHLIEAALTPGESPDMLRAISEYSSSLGNFYGREKTKPELQAIVKSLPENSKVRGEVQRAVDNFQKQTPAALRKASELANLYYIYGVPITGLTNLSTVFNTIGEATQRMKLDAPGALAKASAKTAEYYASPKEAFAKKNPELGADLLDIQRRGVIDTGFVGEALKDAQGKPQAQAEQILQGTFATPEKFVRTSAYITGWELARRQGLSGDARRQYAEDFMFKTQFDQSKANRPNFQFNPAFRMAAMFKNYAGNQLSLYRKYLSNKEFTALGTNIGLHWLAAGALGSVPFAKDVVDLFRGFGVDLLKSVRELYDGDTSETILSGPLTKYGINISGNVGTGGLLSSSVDSNAFETLGKVIAGAPGAVGTSAVRAYDAYKLTEDPTIALEQVAPRSIRGPLKALRAELSGEAIDTQGKPILNNLTSGEKNQLALGASPNRVSRAYQERNSDAIAAEKAKDQERTNARLSYQIGRGNTEKALKIIEETDKRNRENEYKVNIDPNTVMRGAIDYMSPEGAKLGRVLRAPKQARPEIFRNQEIYRRAEK